MLTFEPIWFVALGTLGLCILSESFWMYCCRKKQKVHQPIQPFEYCDKYVKYLHKSQIERMKQTEVLVRNLGKECTLVVESYTTGFQMRKVQEYRYKLRHITLVQGYLMEYEVSEDCFKLISHKHNTKLFSNNPECVSLCLPSGTTSMSVHWLLQCEKAIYIVLVSSFSIVLISNISHDQKQVPVVYELSFQKLHEAFPFVFSFYLKEIGFTVLDAFHLVIFCFSFWCIWSVKENKIITHFRRTNQYQRIGQKSISPRIVWAYNRQENALEILTFQADFSKLQDVNRIKNCEGYTSNEKYILCFTHGDSQCVWCERVSSTKWNLVRRNMNEGFGFPPNEESFFVVAVQFWNKDNNCHKILLVCRAGDSMIYYFFQCDLSKQRVRLLFIQSNYFDTNLIFIHLDHILLFSNKHYYLFSPRYDNDSNEIVSYFQHDIGTSDSCHWSLFVKNIFSLNQYLCFKDPAKKTIHVFE